MRDAYSGRYWSSLYRLPLRQIPDLVDYINFIRLGLEGQVRNLPTILSQIIDNRVLPQRLVLETLTCNLLPQLRSRPSEELFQLDTNTVNFDQADMVWHSLD